MKNPLFRKIVIEIILPIISITLCSLTAVGQNVLSYPSFQRGMSYVTWSKEGFASKASDESLESMASAGVTSIAIVPTWYQETFDSTEIESTDRSPSDSSLRHAIQKAQEFNMKVMLKPHIDLIKGDDNTRSDIGFSSNEKWQRWFDNYSKFILHYAKIASEENVQYFCIGTELSFAASQKTFWTNVLIPEVRKIYGGQITYAANWDEFANVEFWGELDYIGIDAYFPLSNKQNPSVEDLKEGWQKWIQDIEAVQNKFDKPILFTEAGYCSSPNSAKKPWEEARQSQADTELQAKCYRALLETFWNKPYFFGIYWWNWNTYPGSGGPNNKGFTPQNKPALDLVMLWYTGELSLGEKLALSQNIQKNIAITEVGERLSAQPAMPNAAVSTPRMVEEKRERITER